MKITIHDDDYGQIEREHSSALSVLESLGIAGFSEANDVLMRVQDHAYQLGVERGKQMQKESP